MATDGATLPAPAKVPEEALPPSVPARAGVSFRAVALGIALALAVNVMITDAEYVVHASRMNLSHFPVALLAVYTLVALVARRFGCAAEELAVILAMGLVASAVPTSGLMGFWLGVLATPYYFATPENRWAELFHPYLPRWFVPRNDGRAMEWLYNGVPPGLAAPWHVWIVPLVWWTSLVAAIVVLTLCIAAILRKPWVEHERLVFPIAQAGLALARTERPGDRVPTIFRRRLFQVGFGIAFGVFAWNAIGYFQLGWPQIKLYYEGLALFRGFPAFALRFDLLTLGLCYFANASVLLSVWVFFLIVGTQSMIFARIGYAIGPLGDDWSSIDPMAEWEGFGALAALVLYGLWTAREHLGRVLGAAWRGGSENDDPRELLSYRMAVFGGLAALVYIPAWLHAAGMAWTMAITWTAATLVIFVGVARIVSETGLPYVRGPLTAQSFTAYGLGSANYGSASITILTFTYAFVSQGKGLFMTPFMHAAKLASGLPSARRMARAVIVAMAVGIAVCLVLTLWLGYTMGAFNFEDYPFSAASRHMFVLTAKYITDPQPAAWDRWRFFGIGAAALLAITCLRARLPWWPLSPIGLTIATTYATINSVLMVFVAWAAKSIVLRVGGVALYRRSTAFFLGLAAGYAMGVAFSFGVDAIFFPGAGHHVHSW